MAHHAYSWKVPFSHPYQRYCVVSGRFAYVPVENYDPSQWEEGWWEIEETTQGGQACVLLGNKGWFPKTWVWEHPYNAWNKAAVSDMFSKFAACGGGWYEAGEGIDERTYEFSPGDTWWGQEA